MLGAHRDRGGQLSLADRSPPTPPGMRVRTGRFEQLRYESEVRSRPRLPVSCRAVRASSRTAADSASPRPPALRPVLPGF